MPRDGSNIYSQPFPDVVEDTTIESTVYNGFTNDVAQDLNTPRPVIAGGTGASTAEEAANNLGVVSGKGVQTFTDAEKTQARANVYAAPFDALDNGMQFNGSMEVSQELGTAGLVFTAGSINKFVLDGWRIFKDTPGTVSAAQIGGVGVGALSTVLQLQTGTAHAPLTGAQTVQAIHSIEGYRFSRAGWGTASAMPVTVGFWMQASVAGVYKIFGYNFDASTILSPINFTITSPGPWQWVTLTLPAQTTGTWKINNEVGFSLVFVAADAATPHWLGNVGNIVRITGVVVLPGIEAPTAARSPLIMRPYDQELLTCQRYYSKTESSFRFTSTGVMNAAGHVMWPREMRTTPTTAVGIPAAFANLNGAYPQLSSQSVRGAIFNLLSGGSGDCYALATPITADARL